MVWIGIFCWCMGSEIECECNPINDTAMTTMADTFSKMSALLWFTCAADANDSEWRWCWWCRCTRDCGAHWILKFMVLLSRWLAAQLCMHYHHQFARALTLGLCLSHTQKHTQNSNETCRLLHIHKLDIWVPGASLWTNTTEGISQRRRRMAHWICDHKRAHIHSDALVREYALFGDSILTIWLSRFH